MTNLIKTAALSLTLIGASTSVFAAAHADVEAVTCADFAAMEIIDQEPFLVAVTAITDDVVNDDIKPSDVTVMCNGMDDETVASLLAKLDDM